MSLLKVLAMGNSDIFSKNISAGMGTFAVSLSNELAMSVKLDYFTYNSLLHGAIKSILRSYIYKKYDVIHDFTGWSYYRKRPGYPPYVVTLHDLTVNIFQPDFLFRNNYKGLTKGIWFRTLKSRIIKNLKQADRVIAVSTLLKELAIDYFDIDEEKIYVVNHGISFQSYKSKFAKADKFIISTLSNLEARKNPKMLLRAFELFRVNLPTHERDKVELHLYGNVNETFKEWLNLPNYGKNIFLEGPIEQTTKQEMYCKSSVFVFPSIEEGFGMPIMEAQWCGIPIIIFGSGIISSEVGKYVYKAYTAEEMANLFLNFYKHGFPKNIKNKQITYARGFTWKKAAKEILRIYNDIT